MDALYLLIVPVVGIALGIVAYVEYKARLLHTRVTDSQTSLRFEARNFSVDVLRKSKQVRISSKIGQLRRTPLADGASAIQHAPLDEVFAAAGLRIEFSVQAPAVQPPLAAPTSPNTVYVTFTASDAPTQATHPAPDGQASGAGGATSVLYLEGVPRVVAQQLEVFVQRIRIWVEKIEARLKLEQIARSREERLAQARAQEDALAAEAAAQAAVETPSSPADPQKIAELQIAKWREKAGFTGAAHEVGVDAQGRVEWFIDVANDGRITLHANKRTVHSTLKGSSIAALGAEIEIGVRDEYWSEDEPNLYTMRLFKGASVDKRRAWKERLEQLRDKLGK